MNTIYITFNEAELYPTGAWREQRGNAYAVPFVGAETTWALGIERVYVAFDSAEPMRIIRAFGTKADVDAYVAETGNDDIGRCFLDRSIYATEVAA